jgi:hypothetical protein
MMMTSVSMRPRIAHRIGTVKLVECKRFGGNGRFVRASLGQILLCPLNVGFALDSGRRDDIPACPLCARATENDIFYIFFM